MPGRRWSDGLHQAVEAKEGVEIRQENQTMASITFQNYFRMYKKLAGMTGTADTEAYEFQDIYGLETVVIPTNRQMIRVDQQDKVFRTETKSTRLSSRTSKTARSAVSPYWWGPPRLKTPSAFPSSLRRKASHTTF